MTRKMPRFHCVNALCSTFSTPVAQTYESYGTTTEKKDGCNFIYSSLSLSLSLPRFV